MSALGIVEAKRAGKRLEHVPRDPTHVASLEARVVRNAYSSQDRDFLSTKSRHPAAAVRVQPSLLRSDPSAPRREEVADLLLRFHEIQRRPAGSLLGDTVSSPINRDSHVARTGAFLECKRP